MQPREEWRLDTHLVGRRVLVFDQLESTNSYAAGLARDPANDGVAVLAREQTAGRGQYGRSWLCPPDSGVLLSVLVFPPPTLRRPVLITAWAAVSVCRTVRELTGIQPRIKWPNDVLLRERKVCGILIEQSVRTGAEGSTVVGSGLNVNQTAEAFAGAGLTEATSLGAVTGKPHDWAGVARLLLTQLDTEYRRLRAGDLTTLEADWRCHLGLLGNTVLVECHEADHRGRLREIGWNALEVELADGTALRLAPESVRHVHPAP
jgi:BirA family biotin operon repressor/biotin-[acetyl-CoA-carboxylase] ligase